ncbi:GIY-YIG nuclease family protein [Natrinema salinisoli]|uniref:GIY-YIG nuclease family protein n=1 Tax=Natrinema salinisoli TaxID=2878535 RepID=UPI001CF0649F|nr:GIY-YIG nuclease family protein [Natrinema salinisoli]
MTGTYVLVIGVTEATTIEVGALGDREFTAGTYAYVGSAFGRGGFSRIDRHRELAAGDRETRHWHIDYLLGDSGTRLETAITFPDADRECELAGSLPGTPVPDFGASDCDCGSHLLGPSDTDTVIDATVGAGGIVDG